MIEHYIEGDEFVINYFFVDGEPFVLYTKDYCKNIVDGKVMRDNAMISPSKYEKLFYEKADAKLREMFRDVGMSNGIIFLQCFEEDGELYFFEGGCRSGGADEFYLWNSIYGVDFIKGLLHFALDGTYGIQDLRRIMMETHQNTVDSVLNVLISEGTIQRMDGLEQVAALPEALAVTPLRHPGDVIAMDGTNGQIALRVMVEARNADHYLETIDRIYSLLHIESTTGKDMLIPHLDFAHWVKPQKERSGTERR